MNHQQTQIIINRLNQELIQAETFIAQGINLEYWQGVKHGIEIALDGFRAVGISVIEALDPDYSGPVW